MDGIRFELNVSFAVAKGNEGDFLAVMQSTAMPFCRESEEVLKADLKRVWAEGLEDSDCTTFCLQVGFETKEKLEEWKTEFKSVVLAKFRRAFGQSVLTYPSVLETLV